MTTQPDNRCDPNVFKNGRSVAIITGTSTAIEAIVVRVREELNVPLDWHFSGGYGNILTTAPEERDAEIRYRLHASIPQWHGERPRHPNVRPAPSELPSDKQVDRG